MIKRRKDRLPPFVPLTWQMLNSQAYKELPASAAKALPYFLGKVKVGYNDLQKYHIEFSLSYTEAQRFSFAVAIYYRVIENLTKYGFIDPIDKGGLRSRNRSYNLFRLSMRWKLYGTSEFERIEWRCFQPRINKVHAIFEKRTASEMRKKEGE